MEGNDCVTECGQTLISRHGSRTATLLCHAVTLTAILQCLLCGNGLADPAEDFGEILSVQHQRFIQIESVDLAVEYTSESFITADRAAVSRSDLTGYNIVYPEDDPRSSEPFPEPRVNRYEFAFDGSAFHSRHSLCAPGSDVQRVIEVAHDGDRFMVYNEQAQSLGLCRDLTDANNPNAFNPVLLPFAWISPEGDLSFQSLAESAHWAPERFSSIQEREVTHAGQQCLEFSFDPPDNASVSPIELWVVRFARDLGYFPIHFMSVGREEWLAGETVPLHETEVLEWITSEIGGAESTFPQVIRCQGYWFGSGDISSLDLYTVCSGGWLTLNEPIGRDRFTITPEQEGVLIWDMSTGRPLVSDAEFEAWNLERIRAARGIEDSEVRVLDPATDSPSALTVGWLAIGLALTAMVILGLAVFAVRR